MTNFIPMTAMPKGFDVDKTTFVGRWNKHYWYWKGPGARTITLADDTERIIMGLGGWERGEPMGNRK